MITPPLTIEVSVQHSAHWQGDVLVITECIKIGDSQTTTVYHLDKAARAKLEVQLALCKMGIEDALEVEARRKLNLISRQVRGVGIG